MFRKNSPIGVIDSGIGGFSVARKVQKLLPHENLLYFGDGANTPYGNHSADEILEMTRYMLRFMEEKGVKALLVACNTISCLINQYGSEMSCPVLSVVQAGADAVQQLPDQVKKVGVISTVFTHKTGCYAQLIGKSSPEKTVLSHGCPDLAILIEQHVGDPAAQHLIDADLKRELTELVELENIRYCVLGCTHYPLVADNMTRLFPGLTLLDPAEQMAKTVLSNLQKKDLVNDGPAHGTLDIYTTGSVEEYMKKAEKVGLNPVTSVQSYPAKALD